MIDTPKKIFNVLNILNIQYSLFNKFQLQILWKITDEKLAVTEAPIVYPTVVLKILQ